jgi:hypothetical protein
VLRTGAGLAAVSAALLVAVAVARSRLAAPAGTAALDRSRSLLRVAAYDATVAGIVRAAAILLVLGVVAAVAAHLAGRLLVPPPGAATPAPAPGPAV